MLSSSFFAGNRRNLSKAIKGGLVLLTASGLVQRTGDTVYPFRQDSNFFYLTGVKEPDMLLVIDGSSEFLVLPKKTEAEQIFGGNINCDEVAKISGIVKILEYQEGWSEIKKLQQRRKKVYTILPPIVKVTHTDSFFTNGNRKRLVQKLKRLLTTAEVTDIQRELIQLRQVKQAVEVDAIRQAIAITGEGITRARALVKPGVKSELLQAELGYAFAKHGVAHAFNPIISSGSDTCTLHIALSKRNVNAEEPVLFDVGAEHQLYSADISRTYFSSAPTRRQEAVFAAVMSVHSYAIDLLKPGLSWREYVLAVDEKMGEELIKLGLITINDRKHVRKYFSHAVSHSLGLDTHDPCDYGTEIKESMVITVEPGIYIKEEALGIRIEDDILITRNGAKNLSAHIPYK